MSIVGPRPQMEVDFLVYPENVKNSIYNTKPGLTGLGSIFFRDEELFYQNNLIHVTSMLLKLSYKARTMVFK